MLDIMKPRRATVAVGVAALAIAVFALAMSQGDDAPDGRDAAASQGASQAPISQAVPPEATTAPMAAPLASIVALAPSSAPLARPVEVWPVSAPCEAVAEHNQGVLGYGGATVAKMFGGGSAEASAGCWPHPRGAWAILVRVERNGSADWDPTYIAADPRGLSLHAGARLHTGGGDGQAQFRVVDIDGDGVPELSFIHTHTDRQGHAVPSRVVLGFRDGAVVPLPATDP